ncbi:hypothetical protein EIP86_005022 [Pleurotus ostreatoroseus]|nr:hypothetical protein EIP86_005022 [Pleurotus ostreatoroseus]
MSQYLEVSMYDVNEQHATSSSPAISDEFKNEPLYLLVEGTVFIVNRQNFINDSEFFQEMYELPPTKDKPVDGYIGATDNITCDEWISVLKLLTLWRFNVGRELVLKKLQSLTDPVTKVMLYDLHGLDPEIWLVPSVNALAQRTEPLSEAEGQRLGINNTVKIYQIRETLPRYRMKRGVRGEPINVLVTRGEHDFITKVRSTYGLVKT